MTRQLSLLALSSWVAACASERPFSVSEACLPAVLSADEAYTFPVFSECAGGVDYRGLRCEVEVAGQVIEVSTPARRSKRRGNGDDCFYRELDCTLPPLPAGSYRVHFESFATQLEVSGEQGDPLCRSDEAGAECLGMCEIAAAR